MQGDGAQMSGDYEALSSEIKQLSLTIHGLKEKLEEWEKLLFGEERFGWIGVVQRTGDNEARIERLEQELQSYKDQAKGLKIGLGLTGAGSGVSLIWLIAKLFE